MSRRRRPVAQPLVATQQRLAPSVHFDIRLLEHLCSTLVNTGPVAWLLLSDCLVRSLWKAPMPPFQADQPPLHAINNQPHEPKADAGDDVNGHQSVGDDLDEHVEIGPGRSNCWGTFRETWRWRVRSSARPTSRWQIGRPGGAKCRPPARSAESRHSVLPISCIHETNGRTRHQPVCVAASTRCLRQVAGTGTWPAHTRRHCHFQAHGPASPLANDGPAWHGWHGQSLQVGYRRG